MKSILLLTLIFITSLVHAAGSFDFKQQLLPILNTNPELKSVVMSTFDFADSGSANRIGYKVNEKLGGQRLGPYYIKAKPKGQNGDYTLTVIIYTEIKFLDANNHELDDFKKAVKINERFYSFEVLLIGNESASSLSNQF